MSKFTSSCLASVNYSGALLLVALLSTGIYVSYLLLCHALAKLVGNLPRRKHVRHTYVALTLLHFLPLSHLILGSCPELCRVSSRYIFLPTAQFVPISPSGQHRYCSASWQSSVAQRRLVLCNLSDLNLYRVVTLFVRYCIDRRKKYLPSQCQTLTAIKQDVAQAAPV